MPIPANPNTLPPGTHLQDGHFILGEVLGEGGFGITYEAHDSVLHRTVAIKEFFPPGCTRAGQHAVPSGLDDASFEAARAAFIEEARILARFSHTGIVSVYAVFPANNTAYMVMEFIRGQSLQQIVEALGPFPNDAAMEVVLPVGAALKAIHDAGLLHGDIKPANIMRASDGRMMLLDFGLTRRIEPNRYATILLAPARYGSPGYAPLEQYGHQTELGPYSDIYALAATLYFLIDGSTPPAATDRAADIALTPRFDSLNPLYRAVMAGMAMQPVERPQSVDEFLALLETPHPDVPAPGDAAPGYAIQVLRPDDEARWEDSPPVAAKPGPDSASAWESETIYSSRSPQSPTRPQRTRRRRGPGNYERYDTPNGTVVTSGGCTGCCACGCLALLCGLAFIGVAVGSVLEHVMNLVTGR